MSQILNSRSRRRHYLGRAKTGPAALESQKVVQSNTAVCSRGRSGSDNDRAVLSPGPLPLVVDVLFYGHDGEECEAFIHQIRMFAVDHDKDDDPTWMARKASACFMESALRWHVDLEDQTRNDWTNLERALMKKYPEPHSRLSEGVVPVAPSSANGAGSGPGPSIDPRDDELKEKRSAVLENDLDPVDVVVSSEQRFQLLESDKILEYIDGEWNLQDYKPPRIYMVADGANIHQQCLTGIPISCWTEVDNDRVAIDATASNSHLYQLQKSGRIQAIQEAPSSTPFRLGRRVKNVMLKVFADKETKSVKWNTFVRAMTAMGFSVDSSTYGSSVTFIPPDSKDSPIAFHKPHPDSSITPQMLHKFRARLARNYGWTEDNFARFDQETEEVD